MGRSTVSLRFLCDPFFLQNGLYIATSNNENWASFDFNANCMFLSRPYLNQFDFDTVSTLILMDSSRMVISCDVGCDPDILESDVMLARSLCWRRLLSTCLNSTNGPDEGEALRSLNRKQKEYGYIYISSLNSWDIVQTYSHIQNFHCHHSLKSIMFSLQVEAIMSSIPPAPA